jgi:uncharacterized protein (DUF2267 family)
MKASQPSAISHQQIKLIHTLEHALGLTKEEYGDRIMDVHGFSRSCKDLTYDEAAQLIEAWEKEAMEKGAWKKRQPERARDGYATSKQEWLVRRMFAEVSYYDPKKQPKAFEHALRNFLMRIAHVEDTRFLERRDAHKVIEALKKMKAKKDASHLTPHESQVYRDRSINW